MLKCKPDDPAKAFSALSAISFILGVAYSFLWFIFGIICCAWPDIGGLIMNIAMSYFGAHLFWWIMIKKNACCGKPGYAIIGGLLCFFGGWGVLGSLLGVLAYPLYIVPTLIALVRSYMQILMGRHCFVMGEVCCHDGAGKVAPAPSSPPHPEAPTAVVSAQPVDDIEAGYEEKAEEKVEDVEEKADQK